MDSCFYVYRYVDTATDEVIYVGKGKNDRAYSHWKSLATPKRSHFLNRLRAIQTAGQEPLIEIMLSDLTEAEALAKEVELIRLYGRRITGSGTLCNVTPGGEGCMLPPDKLRARAAAISRGLKGKKRPAESIAKVAEAKRRWYIENPERAAIAIAALNRARNNPETEAKRIAAVRKAHTGREWPQESKDKLSASRMGQVHSREVLDRIAASKRKQVYCSNGEVYSCREEASMRTGISLQSVWRVCNGKYPSVKGLVFSYERL